MLIQQLVYQMHEAYPDRYVISKSQMISGGWAYKRKIENLIENIDNCIERINMFTENAVFTGNY